MKKRWQSVFALIGGISVSFMPAAAAQSADTPVEIQGANVTEEEKKNILDAVFRLRDEGKPIDRDEIGRQLENPKPETIRLAPRRTGELSNEQLAVLARETSLRVGYAHLCPRCDDWHVDLAGGYAVAEDVVVTCDHVVDSSKEMREGYLAVVGQDGRVAVVSAVLARSKAMDAAVLKVAGAKFAPAALNHDVAQGAAAVCFSHPLRQRGYFSAGIVNRFYWNGKYKGEDRQTLDALRHLRADFSTEWAPGSSGAPLLDQAGNVIAHVSTIAGLGRGKNTPQQLTMRTGIPAQSVQRLIAAMEDPGEIKRLAMLDAGTRVETKTEETDDRD